MDLATIVWLPCTVIVLGLLTEFCATFRSLFQSYRELQEERVRHQNTTRELSRSYMEKGALKSNLWKKEDELKSTAAQVVQLRETLQKEVAELKQERQTHTQEITELKQGRQNLNLEIAGLKRERISHTREIGELKLERQNHLQEIAEHKRKHLIHQQTISGLEENLSKHTDLSKMMNLELCELSLKISREVTARQSKFKTNKFS